MQVPAATEYITELEPVGFASAGFMIPEGETAELPVQVPPPGVAESVCAGKVLQTGAGMVSVGVNGLLMVIEIVLMVLQVASTVGETTMLYTTTPTETVLGKMGGCMSVV
jgi:hypothetical protein